jgi:enterochelin esterase family protein
VSAIASSRSGTSAPTAQAITVNGELDGKPHPMTKGDNGVWTTTVGPLAPDIYTYRFNVDGAVALGSAQRESRSTATATSVRSACVEVPGDGPQFYDTKARAARRSAHPAVRLEDARPQPHVWVYTPPGYDKGRNFPVITLLTAPATSSPAGR